MKQWKIAALCNLGAILLYVVYLVLVSLSTGEGSVVAGVICDAIADLFIVVLSFQAASGVYFYGKTGELKSLVGHFRRQFLLMLPMGVFASIILVVPLFTWSSHLPMPVFDSFVGGTVFAVCSYIVLLFLSLVPMLMLLFAYPFLRGFRKRRHTKKMKLPILFGCLRQLCCMLLFLILAVLSYALTPLGVVLSIVFAGVIFCLNSYIVATYLFVADNERSAAVSSTVTALLVLFALSFLDSSGRTWIMILVTLWASVPLYSFKPSKEVDMGGETTMWHIDEPIQDNSGFSGDLPNQTYNNLGIDGFSQQSDDFYQ